MTEEQSPKNLSPLSVVCEKTANFLNLGNNYITKIIHDAIKDLLESHPNNISYSAEQSEEREVILTARKGIQQVRLEFKLLLLRGGALGSMADKKLLKVTRQFNGQSEVVAKEII